MAMYVPGMQQRFTGYDAGRNIANNLLEAVKMNREFEHKQNAMSMEQEKLGMLKESFNQDKKTNEANIYVAGQRELGSQRERDYLDYNQRRKAFGEKQENRWYEINPFKGEKEFRDEFDLKEGGAPERLQPRYAEEFKNLGGLPSGDYVPDVMRTDVTRNTSLETYNALYPNGLMNNSHYATFDDE